METRFLLPVTAEIFIVFKSKYFCEGKKTMDFTPEQYAAAELALKEVLQHSVFD